MIHSNYNLNNESKCKLNLALPVNFKKMTITKINKYLLSIYYVNMEFHGRLKVT